MKIYQSFFLRNQTATICVLEHGLEVSLDNGLKVIHLNGTAKKIWELTSILISLDELVNKIQQTYGREASLVREEVLLFLDDATGHGLMSQFISGH